MCGICGVVQIGGSPRAVLPPGVLDRMTDAMAHRGPDDRGTHEEPGVAVGVRRLSIVDVAGGHQPFASEDGRVWGAQNGELYNHDELRSWLGGRGHHFTSRCDTEVLPHLYEQVGAGFPERLRGKFGLVVWDGRLRRAVIARDRLGVKPVYYAQAGDLLVFASELKSLLASGLIDPRLDDEAIDAYLTFGFVPAPRTPLAGVSKLLPGELLVAEPGRVHAERYWRYPLPRRDGPPVSADEYARGLLDRLEASVRLRLMSDVPLGAMLSGGLDSSLIVALMARNMAEPVKTFSVGFRDDADGNELADARTVAALVGADHHELELSYGEQQLDLAALAWQLDEPLADLSALGFLALSELASRHVTVALSGQGADELLGGYERYRTARLASAWQRLPATARGPLEWLGARGSDRTRRRAALLATTDPLARYVATYAPLEDRRYRDAAARALEPLASTVPRDPLAALMYLDAQVSLPDDMLHYFDRASMAHSLEVRVPFLDHEVVEYCATIPPELKVRGLTTKYLLKHAAGGILPAGIIHKRKIGFFSRSVSSWLHSQLSGPAGEYLREPDPAYGAFIEPARVQRLVEGFQAGRREHVRLLLPILMLEVWLKSSLPRALAAQRRPVETAAR